MKPGTASETFTEVPIDRTATLRNAEKLLRTGKLEPAIAEYLRVVEDQPGDWSTANTLGDLYARAGQTERAVDQFLKVAEALREEGQYVKAAAIYKKLLKLQPDNERALMQAAELVAGQGLYADARALLVDGYDTAAAITAGHWARDVGVPVIADFDDVYPGLEPLLENIDYLIVSRDFPERIDSKYLKHTVAFHREGQRPQLEYHDVRITNFQPQARTY